MSGNHDIYTDIREVYVRPIPEERLDMLLQRVITEIPTRSVPARRRRRAVPRVAVVLAALSIIGGMAAAAPAIIDHFFRSGAPIDENVQRLRMPGDVMPAGDYDRVAGGEGLAASMGLRLAPRSQSRVLADDDVVGRLSVIGAVDGAGFCFVQTPPGDAPQVASCNPALTGSGLMMQSLTQGEGSRQQVFGLAADGVSKITIAASDGKRYPVTLEDNAFIWIAPSSDVTGDTARVEYPDREPVEELVPR